MEGIVAVLATVFLAGAVYLMLSRHVVRMLLGIGLLGNGVNLLLFVTGRLTRDDPPVMTGTQEVLAAGAANPLPQALILTAIVISFSFFAFLLVLAYRAYQDLGTDDTQRMRFAEPRQPDPPSGY